MSEKQESGTELPKRNTGHKFRPGHPRYGGKKKNTAAAARAMAEEMGVDPLQFLLDLVRSEVVTETIIVDGKKRRVEIPVPLELRADCAKTVMNYMYPRLTAQTIQNEVPIQVATFNLTELMKDPAMVEAAQTLALGMAESDRPQISAPGNLERRTYDYATDLETDANGHWRKR